MDLLFSFMVWTALLVFSYQFCTNLGEYSNPGGKIFPSGKFFERLEKVSIVLSIVGLVWLAASILWMLFLIYHHGVFERLLGS